PAARSAAATTAAQSSGFARSAVTSTGSTPISRTAESVRASSSRRTSTRISRAPARADSNAVARPTPAAAPGMTATLPSSGPAGPGPRPLGRQIGALAKGAELRPHHAFLDELRAGERAEATVDARQDARAIADRLDGRRDPVGDDLRVLHHVRRGVDDPREKQ